MAGRDDERRDHGPSAMSRGGVPRVPGFLAWRDAHFYAVQTLGGGAVIYQANPPP